MAKLNLNRRAMKEHTLINSEKVPVVEDLDRMEYCLEIKRET